MVIDGEFIKEIFVFRVVMNYDDDDDNISDNIEE